MALGPNGNVVKWLKTEKNKPDNTNGLGTILVSPFGKTANPGISLFPYGVSSKPIQNKMCLMTPSEINGDNVILGYSFDDDAGLESGEIILFSTNDKEERQATIRIRSKGDANENAEKKEDGKGTIEITAANKGTQTAKITLQSDGNVELCSTDTSGTKKTTITLGNDGNINISSESDININAKTVKVESGNVEIGSNGKSVVLADFLDEYANHTHGYIDSIGAPTPSPTPSSTTKPNYTEVVPSIPPAPPIPPVPPFDGTKYSTKNLTSE